MRRRRKQKGYIEPTALRELVPGVLRGIQPRRRTLEKVGSAWEAVAGEATATRTRVVDFSRGVLTLEVASSALKHDLLTFRKNQLLDGLKERLPDVRVRDLKCRVGTPS